MDELNLAKIVGRAGAWALTIELAPGLVGCRLCQAEVGMTSDRIVEHYGRHHAGEALLAACAIVGVAYLGRKSLG